MKVITLTDQKKWLGNNWVLLAIVGIVIKFVSLSFPLALVTIPTGEENMLVNRL